MSDEIQVLPNEILAIIINKLASDTEDNDRRAALTSCRLASHALYSLATPLLFSSIQLIDVPRNNIEDALAFKERATTLKQILATSDIAASVHTLTLSCHKEILKNSFNGTLISAIIYHLPHIRTFILKSERGTLDFTAIKGDLTSAIKSLCNSPNFTTLDLDNIVHFPAMVIIACPNLQCLRLSGVGFHFDHTNPIDETSNLQPYKLDSLEIDHYSLYILSLSNDSDSDADISFPKHFSRIKNLRIKNLFCSRVTLKCGWDIILLASQSLRTLDLPRDNKFVTGFPDALEDVPFDLGRFPALRHFKIQIRILFGDNVTMLCRLTRLLSISSTSGIETLEIMITWANVKTEDGKDVFSSDAGWFTLDEVLSSEKFVSLQKVVLGLRLEIGRVGLNPELERNLTLPYVNALFPTFRALRSAQRTLESHIEIIPV